MTRARSLSLVAALALGVGCSNPYFYGPVSPKPSLPKPDGCPFALLHDVPKRPFEELGVIAPEDIQYGYVPLADVPYREAVGPLVCKAGGDAVVVEKDRVGRYARGTVIRYR